MSSYTTVVVGTDGSPTSYKAVERAAALAGDAGAKLVIVSAFQRGGQDLSGAADVLKDDAYQVTGSAPTDNILRHARELAAAAGAKDVVPRPMEGHPVESLLLAVGDNNADLLVVGNRGLSSLTGRLLGSVPSDISRRSAIDVLIVHTT